MNIYPCTEIFIARKVLKKDSGSKWRRGQDVCCRRDRCQEQANEEASKEDGDGLE